MRLTPQPWEEDGNTVNAPYRDWLQRTFGVTAPGTALEIVPEPADMDDSEARNPFLRRVDHHLDRS